MQLTHRASRRFGLVVLAVVLWNWPSLGTADEAKTKPATVTEKDNNGKVSLTKGQELVVSLEIKTGTGFTWQVHKSDEKHLEQVGKPAIEKADGKPGSPAQQVFRFKAKEAGTIKLELEYLRPFEKDVKPAKTFQLQVTVQEPK